MKNKVKIFFILVFVFYGCGGSSGVTTSNSTDQNKFDACEFDSTCIFKS